MNREFVMEKAHTEYADHIAYARLTDAVRTGRDYVGHVEGDDKLWSYVRGCRAEMAFYLWLGGKSIARWIDFIVDPTAEQLNFCDMVYRDFKIDVKARPEGWVDFIVRCKGVKPENVYVLAVTDFYPLIIFHG